MSSIDDAIARIQTIALAMTTVTIKSAPDYPAEVLDSLPMVSSYLGSGTLYFVNATTQKNFPTINVEFHFSRANLQQANQQANAVAIEFPQRLAGDPTLNGTVDTIVSTQNQPINYVRRPFTWREQTNTQPAQITDMLMFSIPVKLLKTPTT